MGDTKPDDLIFTNLKILKFVDWGGTSETARLEPPFPKPGLVAVQPSLCPAGDEEPLTPWITLLENSESCLLAAPPRGPCCALDHQTNHLCSLYPKRSPKVRTWLLSPLLPHVFLPYPWGGPQMVPPPCPKPGSSPAQEFIAMIHI